MRRNSTSEQPSARVSTQRTVAERSTDCRISAFKARPLLSRTVAASRASLRDCADLPHGGVKLELASPVPHGLFCRTMSRTHGEQNTPRLDQPVKGLDMGLRAF